MCDWNLALIKGLIKLHAFVPMRESTLPEKQHVAKPEVMKIDALDGMRLASTCMYTAKWTVETVGNTITGGDSGRQKTQDVEDRKQGGRDIGYD